ncbi:DUF3421 domain-containing protein [Thiothrix unzii]|uniref:DUF3421 domain-containing protein n=1 Tax=Thiothrix unzii TaxID=111769 RepID=A0A975FB11_9GAMM|nr:DUF3421 domain-containing protein [Thiothrix unzii]QTR53685.1 DUF3421 domain-containing protein [Thiothrix unzii]
MKKLLLMFMAVTVLAVSSFNASANTLRWVAASPATSCSEICSSAVSSGRDRQGYQFYVCRGFINGEWRPGFNISTSQDSANKCLFELGGGRGESSRYQCLCH